MSKLTNMFRGCLLCVGLTLVAGCGGGTDADGDGSGQGEPATPAVTPSDDGSSDSAGGDSAASDQEGAVSESGEISAAHILIAYDGSAAGVDVSRTKEEALVLATEIAAKARAEGADFGKLAQEFSDGPTGPRGGDLGNFYPQQMVPPFARATQELAVGQVSDPVETEFGFHVIRRQAVKVIPMASAKHILVMYDGSRNADESITRSKEEAHARMEECLKRAREGESFEDLAREYSDGPTGPSGGDLGEFPQGAMVPPFDAAVFAAEVGQITDIVETDFGYHIIYRYK